MWKKLVIKSDLPTRMFCSSNPNKTYVGPPQHFFPRDDVAATGAGLTHVNKLDHVITSSPPVAKKHLHHRHAWRRRGLTYVRVRYNTQTYPTIAIKPIATTHQQQFTNTSDRRNHEPRNIRAQHEDEHDKASA